ncbi:MAG: alpha/beta hydrolase [Rubrivivax sp.]|nr:alpha/beta hydrolase [Rubrivivax sp.]
MSRIPADVQRDTDLAYGPDPAQCLDVYRPGRVDKAPLLFFVHGGGWARGDKAAAAVVGQKVAHWTARGYVVVSVNYRLLPQAQPLEQVEDVARALAWVQRAAPGWGADPAACLLMGHSAGAHLLTLLAADPAIGAGAGARPGRGVVALDTAAFDLVALMEGPHLPLHDQAWGDDPAVWRAGSPIHRLQGRPDAPMLLVCSALRPRVYRQAQQFAARARSFGGAVQVIAVDLSHRELNADLGEDGPYTAAVDDFVQGLGLL